MLEFGVTFVKNTPYKGNKIEQANKKHLKSNSIKQIN